MPLEDAKQQKDLKDKAEQDIEEMANQPPQSPAEQLAEQVLPAVLASVEEEDQFGLFQLRGQEKADETRRGITWVNRPAIKMQPITGNCEAKAVLTFWRI